MGFEQDWTAHNFDWTAHNFYLDEWYSPTWHQKKTAIWWLPQSNSPIISSDRGRYEVEKNQVGFLVMGKHGIISLI